MALQPASPSMAQERPSRMRRWQTAAYLLLRAVGFGCSTLLITWGLFVAFFLAIGGLSFDGLFLQLDNLTGRYADADAGRRSAFQHTLMIAHLILSVGIVVLRRGHLSSAISQAKGLNHG